MCAFVCVGLSEAAGGGWGGQAGARGGPQGSSGQWGGQNGAQGGGQNGQWGGQNGQSAGQQGNEWAGQAGGRSAYGQNGNQGQAGPRGRQQGAQGDTQSLFGPDGMRYGATLIYEDTRQGYESNIPGAKAKYIRYGSGGSPGGSDGLARGRSGQNGQQGWQQGGQQGQGWQQGAQGGQQGWQQGGSQGKQGGAQGRQQGGQQGWGGPLSPENGVFSEDQRPPKSLKALDRMGDVFAKEKPQEGSGWILREATLDFVRSATLAIAMDGDNVGKTLHPLSTHSSIILVSGEGWRYSYGIAHGPHGIGHAVGESFPHGYGGFGAYAPSFGYHLAPPPSLPPHPVIVKLPPTYLPPRPVYLPPKPAYLPTPYVYVTKWPHPSPYGYAHGYTHPYYGHGYHHYHDDDDDEHDHEHGHVSYGDPFLYHKK
ncbi:unnamed protein product [Nesidiocoris tenuis]|uniref:Uncharacterized protein n=1 Tax=Nesidiocoris tenuis TaxID=355587 RepID=A0A6H5HNG2_9HEMI|nr:unnamed protein product [Nesidiocoris tenuis]